MKFEIDPETYQEIAKVIHSDESPVGIDAKKNTHSYSQQTAGAKRPPGPNREADEERIEN